MTSFNEMRRVAWNTLVEALGIDNEEDAALVIQAKSFTVATMPTAADYPRGIIYVSDETSGSTLAFSDGTNWRRVQDRAVVS